MPLHDCMCQSCGFQEERFIPIAELDQEMHCECGGKMERVFRRPAMVAGDYAGYTSPVTGEWVEGRKARREDLARNECIPYETGMRQDFERRSREREEALDRAVEETVESEIHRMPARKRDKLVAEVEAGTDVGYQRL